MWEIIILNRDFQQISFDHQTVVVCEHPSYLLFLGLILIQEVEDPEPNLCGLGALECFDKKNPVSLCSAWGVDFQKSRNQRPLTPHMPHWEVCICLQHKARLVHQEGPESAGDALTKDESLRNDPT